MICLSLLSTKPRIETQTKYHLLRQIVIRLSLLSTKPRIETHQTAHAPEHPQSLSLLSTKPRIETPDQNSLSH